MVLSKYLDLYQFVEICWVSQKCYQFVEFLGGNCLELLDLESYFSLLFF